MEREDEKVTAKRDVKETSHAFNDTSLCRLPAAWLPPYGAMLRIVLRDGLSPLSVAEKSTLYDSLRGLQNRLYEDIAVQADRDEKRARTGSFSMEWALRRAPRRATAGAQRHGARGRHGHHLWCPGRPGVPGRAAPRRAARRAATGRSQGPAAEQKEFVAPGSGTSDGWYGTADAAPPPGPPPPDA
eukprot:gene2038-3748_t